MPKIDLTCFPDAGLIIRHSSGVIYTNQAAGYACLHPEMEGVFCPLPIRPGKTELHLLHRHFKGQVNSITAEDADVVDAILRRNGHAYLKVDRARLNNSYEAWVYVTISGELDSLFKAVLSGFGECEGILTWPNSD
jgi:hypothetical protein